MRSLSSIYCNNCMVQNLCKYPIAYIKLHRVLLSCQPRLTCGDTAGTFSIGIDGNKKRVPR